MKDRCGFDFGDGMVHDDGIEGILPQSEAPDSKTDIFDLAFGDSSFGNIQTGYA